MTMLVPQQAGIPIVRPTAMSKPFWDGCNERKLLFQRCGACQRAVFNPAHVCRYCRSHELTWRESKGIGSIYSWTICHRPLSPAFTTPYAPVIVDLDEGYQMVSNLIGCDTDHVHVGLRVHVVFEAIGDRTLPYFRPA